VVLFLGLMGAITVGVLRQSGLIPTPEPTLVAAPAAKNEFLVIVADFYSEGEVQSLQVMRRLGPALEKAIQDNQFPNALVRVVTVPDKPSTREEALRLANRYQASIIVWGFYDTLGLKANIEIVDSPFLASIGGAKNIEAAAAQTQAEAPPETLRTSLEKELPSQVDYLVLYTIGRVHYGVGNTSEDVSQNLAQQEFEKALQVLEQALNTAQELATQDKSDLATETIYYSIGTVYVKLFDLGSTKGDLELAAQNFQKAIVLKPGYSEAFYNLGKTYQRQKKYDESIQQFLAAAEKDKTSDHATAVDAYNSVGFIYAAQKGDLKQAETYWLKGLDLVPKNVLILANLGFLRYVEEDYPKAIEYTQKSLEYADPTNIDQQESIMRNTCNLGLIYVAQGDATNAAETYQKAISFAGKFGIDRSKIAKGLSSCIDDMNQLVAQKPDTTSLAQAQINLLQPVFVTFQSTPTP
jgi:tetratricopeptide (TPR) repeat protein